jgi:hypothetical protein
MERARSLSDVDFELEIENLAAQIKRPKARLTEKKITFQNAFFLLGPGTVEMYDEIIRRHDTKSR